MIKKFSLPGFNLKSFEVMEFLRYYRNHPEYFYKDRIIDSTYDAHYDLIWSGGREPPGVKPSHNIYGLIHNYKMEFPNLELRYVFTNKLINLDIIHDYQANLFVKNGITPRDKVILNHPLLIEHFIRQYPEIDFIYSTTLELTDLDTINRITRNHIYVLNYKYNLNNDYINRLEHKENIEILCGEPCFEYCEHRNDHQERISRMYIGEDVNPYVCPYAAHQLFLTSDVMSRKTFVTNERIDELSDMGIQYFKISGRAIAAPAWLYIVTYYLVLPEYRDLVREKLLVDWW